MHGPVGGQGSIARTGNQWGARPRRDAAYKHDEDDNRKKGRQAICADPSIDDIKITSLLVPHGHFERARPKALITICVVIGRSTIGTNPRRLMLAIHSFIYVKKPKPGFAFLGSHSPMESVATRSA